MRASVVILLALFAGGCATVSEPVTVGLAFDAQGFPECAVSTGDTVALTAEERETYARRLREANGWTD